MPTIETKVWMALRSRVASLILTPPLPVVWPKGNAPASGKYLDVAHLPNLTVRRFIGSNDPHERPGILQLTVVSPVSLNEAPEVDLQIAGQVAAYFPPDLPMRFDGVTVKVTKRADVAQGYRDEAHWRTPISVYWQCFA